MIQAATGVFTSLVAIFAVVVAGVTYRDQQEINRSQLEIAQRERQRYEQRFASRVAWWWVVQPPLAEGRPRLRLQNRSPAPLVSPDILVQPLGMTPVPDARVFRTKQDVPPCTVMTYEFSEHEFDGDFWSRYPDTEVVFGDPVGRWVATRFGVLPEDSPKRRRNWGEELYTAWSEHLFMASEVPGSRETAGDCGEGS